LTKATFGWKTLTVGPWPSSLEADGRAVTAMIRTSGAAAGWMYLTARLAPNLVTVIVLGPGGELLGHAADKDGQAACERGRREARRGLDDGEAA